MSLKSGAAYCRIFKKVVTKQEAMKVVGSQIAEQSLARERPLSVGSLRQFYELPVWSGFSPLSACLY